MRLLNYDYPSDSSRICGDKSTTLSEALLKRKHWNWSASAFLLSESNSSQRQDKKKPMVRFQSMFLLCPFLLFARRGKSIPGRPTVSFFLLHQNGPSSPLVSVPCVLRFQFRFDSDPIRHPTHEHKQQQTHNNNKQTTVIFVS